MDKKKYNFPKSKHDSWNSESTKQRLALENIIRSINTLSNIIIDSVNEIAEIIKDGDVDLKVVDIKDEEESDIKDEEESGQVFPCLNYYCIHCDQCKSTCDKYGNPEKCKNYMSIPF